MFAAPLSSLTNVWPVLLRVNLGTIQVGVSLVESPTSKRVYLGSQVYRHSLRPC